MATPTTYTTEQYSALLAAIATGATFVKYSDKEVQYRDLNEMYAIKADMEAALNIGSKKKWRRVGVYSKGL